MWSSTTVASQDTFEIFTDTTINGNVLMQGVDVSVGRQYGHVLDGVWSHGYAKLRACRRQLGGDWFHDP